MAFAFPDPLALEVLQAAFGGDPQSLLSHVPKGREIADGLFRLSRSFFSEPRVVQRPVHQVSLIRGTLRLQSRIVWMDHAALFGILALLVATPTPEDRNTW